MELYKRNKAVKTEFITLQSGNEHKIEWDESDENTIVCLMPGIEEGTVDVTVKAGNGCQAAQRDLVLTLEAGNHYCLKLDSGRYKNLSGENAGYVVLTASKAVSLCVCAIE